MRHLFEMFVTSHEDWMQSSLVLNSRNKAARRRRGTYVWKMMKDLIAAPLSNIFLK